MELKQVGEFGLIDLLKDGCINEPSNVIAGIGDDAAVLLPTPRQLQLFTADMLVEKVHFDLKTITPWQLGYKAIAVNLSDIAAMGGAPRHAVVSLALPRKTSVEFVMNLYQGMKEICQEFKVNIVGGDTVSALEHMVINVAVIGEVEPAQLVKRSGANVGDLVVVTGSLGSSAGGLDLLQLGDWEKYDFAWRLVTAHLTPRPQVFAGQFAARLGATSMNDISDGLASELNEIANAGDVTIEIDAERIPIASELHSLTEITAKPALDYALYGGEDYQLVFTIAPSNIAKLYEHDLNTSFTVIGKITAKGAAVRMVYSDGSSVDIKPRGYNHFV